MVPSGYHWREAIEGYLAEQRGAELDRRILEGYLRQPPDELAGEWGARASIGAEPWEQPTSREGV